MSVQIERKHLFFRRFDFRSGALAIGLAAALWAQPYRPVLIVGRSMEPTLHEGSVRLGQRPLWPIRRGDVVVLSVAGTNLVKRVAGAPGDPYRPELSDSDLVVPDGKLFVLGDNAEDSLDSREFGLVPLDAVRYVVERGAAQPRKVAAALPGLTPGPTTEHHEGGWTDSSRGVGVYIAQ